MTKTSMVYAAAFAGIAIGVSVGLVASAAIYAKRRQVESGARI